MRFSDINKKFTEIVSKYIAEGYVINPPTMSGHQGELAKIDLLKGKELIRVWINTESSFSWTIEDAWHGDIAALRVSVFNKEYDGRETVWDSELSHIAEYNFYKVSRWQSTEKSYYTESLDEAIFSQKVRYARCRKSSDNTPIDVTSEKTKDIAVKYLKRSKGYQRVSRDKIKVTKYLNAKSYAITYNDHKYKLS